MEKMKNYMSWAGLGILGALCILTGIVFLISFLVILSSGFEPLVLGIALLLLFAGGATLRLRRRQEDDAEAGACGAWSSQPRACHRHSRPRRRRRLPLCHQVLLSQHASYVVVPGEHVPRPSG